ncbi:MAG: M48 family metallopeptidase [Pseudomonadota bacterium]
MRSTSAARSDVGLEGATARYYDGARGLRLDVGLSCDGAAGALILHHPDLPDGVQYWPLEAIRALRDQARADQLVLTLTDMEAVDAGLITTARLSVTDPLAIAELKRRAPNLNKRDVKRGTARKVVTYLGGAVAAVVLMVFVILPGLSDQLAPLIPIEREVAWGKTVVKQMGRVLGRNQSDLICDNAPGLAALARMEERLSGPDGLGYDIDITVFNIPMVNAFAAPGGQIVLTRGLIAAAPNADGVAGVLAHEIGHVDARDVTRNALRVAGTAGLLSMAVGDFAGGAVAVGVAQAMIDSSYSREAEVAADAFAVQMLDKAEVSAAGFAAFFGILGDQESQLGFEVPQYLRTHPVTAQRAEAAQAFADLQSVTTPVISDGDWAALQRICA